MKTYFLFALLICFVIPCNGQYRYVTTPDWYGHYDVIFYKIDIEADNSSANIKGYAEIVAETLVGDLPQFTLELDSSVRVDSVRMNGRASLFRRQSDLLHIIPPTVLPSGSRCHVTVYYAAVDIAANGFFSAVSNQTDNKWDIPVTWTLSEPFNAKRWFPCKQHLPDKADSTHVFVTVPANLKAGAPGVLSAVTPMPDGRMRYEWKSRYPTAYYLLSFAVADYSEYTIYAHPKGVSTPVPVQNYIYNRPGYLNRHKAMIDTTAALIELLSELYLPYPFAGEKYGHCLAPMGGGMEHQTMTTLSEFDFLLVAHELAHQWFGNLVTCASFQDIWVNEGFASYTEYLVLERLASREKALEWLRETHTLASWTRSGSVFVPEEAAQDHWRIFSMSLSYKKGALLVHQIRHIVGNDPLFFDVLRGFLRKYSFAVASATDFKRYLEEQTGIDFTDFFNQWYLGEGFPIFDLSWRKTDTGIELLAEHTGSAAATPCFELDAEVKIAKADGSDTLLTLPIRSNRDLIAIPISGDVTGIEFDPNYIIPKQVQNCAELRHLPTPDRFVQCATRIRRRQDLTIAFSAETERNCRLKLTDATGQHVFTEMSVKRKTAITLPMEQLPNAVYLLHVYNGAETYIRKVVKSLY
jgi:aminopeptidase N